MASSVPSAIGRYEILREVGRGMMGVVYEAHDTVLARTVALKTIRLAFAVGAEEQEAFERRFVVEARIAARLSHPNIVIVHDVGRDDESGLLYMALEYLDGDPLSVIAAPRAPLPWAEALRLVQRVAAALHHAHAQGIVHRDVKPANIMRLRSGEPKVMDFGIARLLESQAHLTAAGQFFGTPLYMSPEQALSGLVDARSDLFSLGAVLYFLLTGRPAFEGATVPAILDRVLRHEPEPPSRVVDGIPPAVDAMVAHALAKDPSARYASGLAMAEDAASILEGREPQHAAEGSGTLVEVGPLEELVQGAQATSPLPRETGAAVPAIAAGDGGMGFWSRWLIVAAASCAVLAALALAARQTGSRVEPVARVVSPAPGVVGPAAGTPAVAEDEPARLAIDFEHSLRQGRLRVWIDDEAILDEELDSRVTRKVLGLKTRKGSLEELLEVRPGTHEVKVQVSWGDNVKTRRIVARFQPGQDRRLAARLGGLLRKNLSLEWE